MVLGDESIGLEEARARCQPRLQPEAREPRERIMPVGFGL